MTSLYNSPKFGTINYNLKHFTNVALGYEKPIPNHDYTSFALFEHSVLCHTIEQELIIMKQKLLKQVKN